MIFGTIVGSLADRYGRKLAGLTYVATYIASCITKHWSDYGVLMLGRFFGGIATSLLFTRVRILARVRTLLSELRPGVVEWDVFKSDLHRQRCGVDRRGLVGELFGD